jgi:hypothetical protein
MITSQVVSPKVLTEREVKGYEKVASGGSRGCFRRYAELLLPCKFYVNEISEAYRRARSLKAAGLRARAAAAAEVY